MATRPHAARTTTLSSSPSETSTDQPTSPGYRDFYHSKTTSPPPPAVPGESRLNEIEYAPLSPATPHGCTVYKGILHPPPGIKNPPEDTAVADPAWAALGVGGGALAEHEKSEPPCPPCASARTVEFGSMSFESVPLVAGGLPEVPPVPPTPTCTV